MLASFDGTSTTPGNGLVLRVLFFILLVRGFLAFRELGTFDRNAVVAEFR